MKMKEAVRDVECGQWVVLVTVIHVKVKELSTPSNYSCLSSLFLFLYCLQACAHRWKNVYYESEYILPHGYCSIIPATLQGKSQPLIPCYEGIDSLDLYILL